MTKYLISAEVSAITRIPTNTLRYYRSVGKGPRSFRLGSRVVYSEDAVQEWISEQERVSQVGA